MSDVTENRAALLERLKDEGAAEKYFWQALEECKKYDKDKAQEHLVTVLKDIDEAQGNKKYDWMYRALSTVLLKEPIRNFLCNHHDK
jgi:intergrase/recombinase